MEVSSSTASNENFMDPYNQHKANAALTNMCRPLTGVEERADKLRKALQQRILNSKNYDKALNILLVGVAGVGKSSLINSVIRASLMRYGQWAKSGASGGAGRTKITTLLDRINIFFPDSDGDKQEELFHIAPRMIDVCGLPNENTPNVLEVLRLLMYGHIPIGENVSEAYGLGVKKGIAALQAKYPKGDPDLAVDRVVFVHAATDTDFPAHLVNAVMEIAQPTNTSNEDGLVCKRTVPQFGLITMADLIDEMDKAGLKKYDKMRSNFIDLLALRGSTNRFSICRNYHSGLDRDLSHRVNIPTIDEELLGFMYELCDPTIKIDHPNFQLQFKTKYKLNNVVIMLLNNVALIMLALLVLIPIILQKLLG